MRQGAPTKPISLSYALPQPRRRGLAIRGLGCAAMTPLVHLALYISIHQSLHPGPDVAVAMILLGLILAALGAGLSLWSIHREGTSGLAITGLVLCALFVCVNIVILVSS